MERGMPSNPTSGGAMRGRAMMHVDENIALALQAEEQERQKKIDDETKELRQIANLENHPGWKIIRDRFTKVIEEFRSGQVLKDHIKAGNMSDAEIGSLARNTNIIADQLTVLLNSVTIAVAENERMKAEGRNGTTQRVGTRTKGGR